MMQPNQSEMLRIVANYARLFSTLIVGLFVVRMLLRYGDDAYSLIALLGTGTGLALVLKEVVRTSTVPVLGEAFHSQEECWFEQIYNSAMLSSFIAGLVTLMIFVGFAFLLPILKFDPRFNTAAIIFVVACAIQSFFTVAISPLINFYAVSERMVAYNVFLFLERSGDMISALITFAVIGVSKEKAPEAVACYGICAASFAILVNSLAAVLIVKVDSRLVLDKSKVSKKAIQTFMQSAGWNSMVVIAMNFYARVDMLIMNLFFGPFGNMVFSLANQAVAYMRQMVLGLVAGIDAVASRVASKDKDDKAVVNLINRSTGLQSIIVFPSLVILLVFARPLVDTWLLNRGDSPETTNPAICWLMRILVFGVGARCLSEGWIWIMNGAGKVKKYAPVVMIGGLLNPAIAYLALKLSPEAYQFAAPAIVFSSLLFVVHLIAIPMIVSREYSLTYAEVIAPLVKPALGTAVCFVIASAFSKIAPNPFSESLALLSIFAASYILVALFLLIEKKDRQNLMGLLKRLKTTMQKGELS